MAYSYLNLINYVQGKCENKQDNVSPSLRNAVNEAIREEIMAYDYRSLQRHTRTFQAVYDNVYLYPLPADMNDEAIIDIEKYGDFNKGSGVNYRKVNLRKFNSNKDLNSFAFDYDYGLRWLKGNFATTHARKQLETMESLTDNGTWTATDDGSAILLVSDNHISGSYAIQITNTGTANSIVNSTMTAVDISLTNYVFVWVYFPTVSTLSNVTILYGSDSSNYYSSSATSPFNQDSFVTGWNLIGVPRSSETTTGSPDEDNIDYVKITANYSSANTDKIVFDSVFAAQGDGFDLIYNSYYAWRDTGGTWKELSTSDSDLLNVGPDEFDVLKKKVAYEIATQCGVGDTSVSRLYQEYDAQKKNYQMKYPSQRKKTKSYY